MAGQQDIKNFLDLYLDNITCKVIHQAYHLTLIFFRNTFYSPDSSDIRTVYLKDLRSLQDRSFKFKTKVLKI